MLDPARGIAVLTMSRARSADRGERAQRMNVAAALLTELRPETPVEGLLAAQMIATHHAAMTMLERATITDQPTEIVDRCVTRAVRLQRVFLEQTAALAKLRGQSAPQRVAVEHRHVHVHTTAQAARLAAADGSDGTEPVGAERAALLASGVGDGGADGERA